VTSAYNLIGDGSTLLNLSHGVNSNQIGTSASPLNPGLVPLANNGGPTQTMALLASSPARGAGDPFARDPSGNLLTTHQRGLARPTGSGATPDAGAFQLQAAGVATHFVITAPAQVTAGTPFTFTVTALDDFGNTATSYNGTVRFASSDPFAGLPLSAL